MIPPPLPPQTRPLLVCLLSRPGGRGVRGHCGGVPRTQRDVVVAPAVAVVVVFVFVSSLSSGRMRMGWDHHHHHRRRRRPSRGTRECTRSMSAGRTLGSRRRSRGRISCWACANKCGSGSWRVRRRGVGRWIGIGCPLRPGKRPWFVDGPDVDDKTHGGAFAGGNWRVIAASVLHPLQTLCRLMFAAACPVVWG